MSKNLSRRSFLKVYAATLAAVGAFGWKPTHPIAQAIKRGQENDLILVELSQLSGLSIDEVVKKTQNHPLGIDTLLDFYRTNGRFPKDD